MDTTALILMDRILCALRCSAHLDRVYGEKFAHLNEDGWAWWKNDEYCEWNAQVPVVDDELRAALKAYEAYVEQNFDAPAAIAEYMKNAEARRQICGETAVSNSDAGGALR